MKEQRPWNMISFRNSNYSSQYQYPIPYTEAYSITRSSFYTVMPLALRSASGDRRCRWLFSVGDSVVLVYGFSAIAASVWMMVYRTQRPNLEERYVWQWVPGQSGVACGH